jgi:hypothetical protein
MEKFLSTPYSHTGGEYIQFHSLLSSALDRGKWFTSSSGHFTLGKYSRYILVLAKHREFSLGNHLDFVNCRKKKHFMKSRKN